MLGEPQLGDLLICHADASRPQEVLIVDALTRKRLAGPFACLRDAIEASGHVRRGVRIWRDHTDDRGRAFPILLPIRVSG